MSVQEKKRLRRTAFRFVGGFAAGIGAGTLAAIVALASSGIAIF